jgi:Protein of unknown function (DUF2842)
MRPTLRKPFGIVAILVGLTLYVAAAVSLIEPIGDLHALVQLPVYLVLGLAWILPLRPALIWMETGRWR